MPENTEGFGATVLTLMITSDTRADSSQGYYLWPRKAEDPLKLFDAALKKLDDIRREWKVYIDWDSKTHYLRINAEGHLRDAEARVAGAIGAVKVKILDAEAQVILATPVYIVVPPTVEGIRTIVLPCSAEDRVGFATSVITSIALAGEQLSAAEKEKYKSIRDEMNAENYTTFRTHLFSCLRQLKDLRSWMRMRVQLGHVHLSEYHKEFYNGTFSFEMFAHMMKKSRVATGGSFDRK